MSRVVAVSGGRAYSNGKRVFEVLDQVHAEEPISLLIQGECPDGGADELSRKWAKSREVNYQGVPPKVKKYGWPAAGPKRNREMGEMRPTLWVLFPGGRGTASAKAIANELEINTYEVKPIISTQPVLRPCGCRTPGCTGCGEFP